DDLFHAMLEDQDHAIAKHPDDWNEWYTRGVVRFLWRHYDTAVADFSRAIELKPNEATVWLMRARANEQVDRLTAIAHYSKAIELDPGAASVSVSYERRGKCNADLARYSEAVDDFTQAMECMPCDDGRWYLPMWRGNAFGHLNQHTMELYDYNLAVEGMY